MANVKSQEKETVQAVSSSGGLDLNHVKILCFDFIEGRQFEVEEIDWTRDSVIEKKGSTHFFDDIRIILISLV